jgi:hypothetical protein
VCLDVRIAVLVREDCVVDRVADRIACGVESVGLYLVLGLNRLVCMSCSSFIERYLR